MNKNLFYFSPQLRTLFNCLLKNGDEIRVVGGAVRDFLSQRTINDIDLVCKYPPQQTLSILKKHNIKTIVSGLKYGTITAIIDGKQFQITTLRQDVENFGRDCKVEFINDFYLDAKRRDFTINAMSIDFASNLYDYFGGKEDLADKKVRFIGDANQRIQEDYLRILRFFRFSCVYGSKIDWDGFDGCIQYKKNILGLSCERIKGEFFKILSCHNRDNLYYVLSLMHKGGILSLILQDEVNLDRLKNLFELEKILKNKFEPIILLVTLCFEPQIKLSRAEKKYLNTITKPTFIVNFKSPTKDLLDLLYKFDNKTIIDIFTIQLVCNNDFSHLISDFLTIHQFISSSNVPDFIIDGNDLIAIGIKPQDIGKTLRRCREYWINNNFLVNKQQIIKVILEKSYNHVESSYSRPIYQYSRSYCFGTKASQSDYHSKLNW